MSTTIRGTDDSAAAPALTGNDQDTGVYFPADNTLGLVTGGTEQVRVDSSGNTSIGTSSPSATYGKLTVAGTGITIDDDNNAKLQIGRYSALAPHSYIKMGANSSGLKITNPADNADVMTLDSSGNASIKGTLAASDLNYSTTSPTFTLGDAQYGMSSGGSQLHLHTLAGGVTVVDSGTTQGIVLHTGNFTSSTVTTALGYTPVSKSVSYSTTVSLSGKSAGSWYDLIPTNTLDVQGLYAVRIYWGHITSGTPFLLTCAFLFSPIYSNGSGTGNSFTPICSTHVGGGYTFSFRGLFASGFVSTGLQFSSSFTGDGNIEVYAYRLI